MPKSVASFVIFLGLLVSLSAGQKLLGPIQITAPDFEKDKKGQLMVFNYDIKLEPFTNPKLSLSDYKSKNFILFYFSATCPHCKHSAPYLLKLQKEQKEKGLEMLAVASGNNRESDLGTFITEQKVDVPVFLDKDRGISENYGTGSVPVIMMVNKKGHFVKLKGFNDNETIFELQAALSDTSRY